MPIIGAIFGAIMLGLVYWIMWGGGMAYLDALLSSHQERRRREQNARRRIESEKEAAKAPLRSLADPREAAAVLMLAVAHTRGELTPEQLAVINEEMRGPLQFNEGLDSRLSFCRFAVERSESPEVTIDEVAPLLQRSLDPNEQAELRTMLDRVAALHGGPTQRQERFIELAARRVAEAP